ncbi:MAG: NAD-dependent epimerase/dehydratase family protein [Phenylobacterium sp.]|uniref:SDR family oxidoreductase n=1 Tax=Phenylobacterium sp. TaxID=1871053 RepID=UPI0025D28844|nr:aldehyde reductase [Phenylobacterium sp.]MBI1198993.1 NAD-dependent epimerase/dehydratase family protein [Phenylobacterium sp.]
MTRTNGDEVLVTGGSGYLAGWIIAALLRQGSRVRTTVRSLAREGEVRAAIAAHVDPGDRLSFFEADLLKDEGWERAAAGCRHVLHVASPMPVREYARQDLVRPAREGVLRVLKAASGAGVDRVVMTSSLNAAMPRAGSSSAVADEETWTDLSDRKVSNYTRSKTLAEQDAWAYARSLGGPMELVTVLPAFIQGPVFSKDVSGSLELVARLLKGEVSALPQVGFSIVDIRDLVDLHLSALTSPAAKGQRFIAASDFLWMSEIAQLLRDRFGADAAKVPVRRAPDLMVRFAARFDPSLREIASNLGKRRECSAEKAKRLLAWRARPAAESIIDGARSMIEARLA